MLAVGVYKNIYEVLYSAGKVYDSGLLLSFFWHCSSASILRMPWTRKIIAVVAAIAQNDLIFAPIIDDFTRRKVENANPAVIAKDCVSLYNYSCIIKVF